MPIKAADAVRISDLFHSRSVSCFEIAATCKLSILLNIRRVALFALHTERDATVIAIKTVSTALALRYTFIDRLFTNDAAATSDEFFLFI